MGFNSGFKGLKFQIYKTFLDFKLSPCCEFCILPFGRFSGAWIVCADVSEHSICSNLYRTCEQDTTYEDGTGRVFRNVCT